MSGTLTLLFANNAVSTLAQNIGATDTSIVLATTTGERFPNPQAGQYFVATMADAATGTILEIVHCTARNVDTLTVARGQENTTPAAYLAGDYIANQLTAAQMVNASATSPGNIADACQELYSNGGTVPTTGLWLSGSGGNYTLAWSAGS